VPGGGPFRRAIVAAAVATTVGGCDLFVDRTPPSIAAHHEFSVALSADTPWLVRALHLRAVPGAQRVEAVRVSLSSNDRDDGPAAANVWISVVDPDDGGFVMDLPAVQAGLQTATNVSVECPPAHCDETWLVIVRLLDPAPDETVDVILNTELRANAAGFPSAGETFALDVLDVAEVEVPDPGLVHLAGALVSGRWRIAEGDDQIVRHYVVEVDDAVMAAAREAPLIARIGYFGERTASSADDIFLYAAIEVADDPARGEIEIGGRRTTEMNLVELCGDRDPCRVPLTITWSIIARVAGTVPAEGDWADSRWWLAATVEGDPGLDLLGAGVRITEAEAGP
jgi:hypothetical protein